MAENDTPKNAGPKNAEFVQRIVSDAKNPPQTRTFTGWFGDAAKEGFRRLYLDAQLSSYVDIPSDAILHTEPVKDSQPPGAVMVWVKADAQIDSSSASSRGSRFLQGDLTKDLLGEGAQERGGFRCVTQPPCAEPTGFTGLCTKQPDVGGCWPCITAIPHCFEPTGFTGKCTHVPWPLPTRYAHCTVLHCPTFDLTCIPQVCNAVASGIPGCGGGSPIEQGGGPQEKVGAAAESERAIPRTDLLGCGFTKEWGLCQTQLLHCQTISQGLEPCTRPIPVEFAARAAGGAAAGGGAGIQQQTFFLNCPTRESFCTLFGPICPSQEFQCTFFGPQCPPTPGIICTQFQTCGLLSAPPRCPNPSAVDACPTRFRCPTRTIADPFGGGVNQAQFGAAAPAPTPPVVITGTICPSAFDACPSHGCTAPITTLGGCTQIDPKVCPTGCGPHCQTEQPECTKHFGCTQFGPACPSFGFECTAPPQCPNPTFPPQCLDTQQPGCTAPPQCPIPTFPPQCIDTQQPGCTAMLCVSQEAPCPTTGPVVCQTPTPPICDFNQAQAFGVAAPAAARAAILPTSLPGCRSLFGPICPSPIQFQCPSRFPVQCPSPGPLQCPSPLPFRCPPSPFCPSPFVICPPITRNLQCPTGIACQASPIPRCGGGVSLGACPSVACQPGGGGIQEQFGAGVTRGMCPTPGTTCCPLQAAPPIGITNFDCPTPNTFCFVCPPDQFQAQQQAAAAFFPNPTPATRCFICPPQTLDFNCGTQQVNTFYPCTRIQCGFGGTGFRCIRID